MSFGGQPQGKLLVLYGEIDALLTQEVTTPVNLLLQPILLKLALFMYSRKLLPLS
jgi:hypothetical protein